MITFIDYKYKGIGGVGQLVVNTTLEINRRGKKTQLYCSRESYEYTKLREWNADFEYIDSDIVSIKQLKEHLSPEDVIVLTQIGESPLLEEIKVLNNKILFYSVHPDTFFCYQPLLNLIFNQNQAGIDLIKTLYDNDSLLIMDWPNVKAIYNHGGEKFKNLTYLPVPVMNYTKKERNMRPIGNKVITYLGRGNDEWKVFPIIKVLEDMNKVETTYVLTIITDSNSMFIEMIQKYVPDNKIRIEYVNGIFGEKLENYLLEKSTLHIAMGTSALEGAKLGIPTILIDYSKQKFPDNYKYRWLYQCEGFSLGDAIDKKTVPYGNGMLFTEILQTIESDEGYKKKSEECKHYVDRNHSIEYFVNRLEKSCENTQMTSQMYCNTQFSKNLYRYYSSSIRNVASKLRRFLFGDRYDV